MPIPSEHFGDRCNLDKHFEYKYIMIIDGNCIASNHQWVFGSGSVPIMITHPDNNWWFKEYLKPIINFIYYNIIMSNYIIAIPSYNRYDVISNKTLKTLQEGNVSKNKIFIFVANKEQFKLYEENVDKRLYHKLVIGKLGITHQRIFISKYFPIGQYIVSLDDDIEEVSKLRGMDKLVKIKDLNKFFINAYDLMREKELYIWGIYPVRNPFFMKNNISYDLKFIIGMMYGYINRHDKKLYPSTTIETREDYEMSVLYYKMDGGVIRFNNVNPKTKFNAEGGVGKDRLERNKKSAEYLVNKYPDIFSLKYRKNGMIEVRMHKL